MKILLNYEVQKVMIVILNPMLMHYGKLILISTTNNYLYLRWGVITITTIG
jgi:hypothetical protein